MTFAHRILALFALFLVAACAEGDNDGFRAVYTGTVNGGDMTVVGTANGNLNFTIEGEETRGLHVDGADYIIFKDEDEELVLDAKVMGELLADAVPPQLKEMMEAAPIQKIELRDDGETDVNGRKGNGYRNAAGEESGPFFVVISKDPELMPYAKAMSKQFTTSLAINPMAREGMFDNVVKVIESGFPLAMGDGKLTEFEQVRVHAGTFDLPGQPLDKEATRKAMIARGMLPEKPLEIPEEMSKAIEKQLEKEGAE